MKKPGIVRWVLLFLFAAALIWIAVGQSSCVQGVRAMLGRKPDQPVLNSSFQVLPRSFRYYKFSLPAGSRNMALVGHFSAAVPAASASNAERAQTPQPANANSTIEVYVLPESSFEAWRNGDSGATIYQSGRVSDLKVQQTLPAGDGVYYLLFSNRFDSAAAKKIDASFMLHSDSWFAF
ncbi:MAG TPA: hypothetical protein VM715_07825 [Candidatus Acidoferrum sp.]|jgi:hypothetical protein|nr:hypothetical protein [Candidatus Acidoferrum sp.]